MKTNEIFWQILMKTFDRSADCFRRLFSPIVFYQVCDAPTIQLTNEDEASLVKVPSKSTQLEDDEEEETTMDGTTTTKEGREEERRKRSSV